MIKIGLDIGSTTLKCAVLDENNNLIYSKYERHFSRIAEKAAKVLSEMDEELKLSDPCALCISGSAGMGLAENLGITFVQEVYATRLAVKRLLPQTDVVIELGGEDAKILFIDKESSGGLEVRMNGTCAGGTGAFIDQMATLLNISPDEMNECAKNYEKIYTIASRCGVFAKTDIQPLINQGAKKSDISISIFDAVVNQTIGGLAQGRPIEGNVVYLGGPMTFFSELRKRFDHRLKTTGICPENSLYFVAMGAAFSADSSKPVIIADVIDDISGYSARGNYASCPPLFKSEDDYKEFSERHGKTVVDTIDPKEDPEKLYLGVDSGSTTVKAVAIDENENIVFSEYLTNKGNPVTAVKNFLEKLYNRYPTSKIYGSTATGYGEELVKNAFNLDFGIVETIAHFTAAKKFDPKVDFIIDIGGQDIKCFKIRNGAIDNIFLNEACSSGCGSFLQTFASALGYTAEEFAKMALKADNPVDLGSRCTVFMNSSVKQAQKDGATVENISAGLAVSVVKNALYKVIRCADASQLGEHIVVQGGTFLNDAVLRAFENEIGRNVERPSIAGLMGAYGAALYSKSRALNSSTTLTLDGLKTFSHEAKTVVCQGCENHCRLTVNTFDGGRRFIGGNRCEKPITNKSSSQENNLWAFKRELLASYISPKGVRGKIGMPFGLNMYELRPFWNEFFTSLGFEVVFSNPSSRKMFVHAQQTIPSDTVCYPAKLIHGHVQQLIEDGIDTIFYPCMSYNLDDGLGVNHYNCPVVAYYPEVIGANMPSVKKIRYIYDYVGIDMPKFFPEKMTKILAKYFDGISLSEVKTAADKAYKAYHEHIDKIRAEGLRLMMLAEEKNLPVIVLCGRPYHLDPEVNHGIDGLVAGFGAVVLSEESVSYLTSPPEVHVLNQWTYHSRLYNAAEFVAERKNYNLVQLVSFGCGVDAITTDEVRRILESNGKIYTQLKIDEINNLGAVKIRMRSLFAVLDEEKGDK